MTPIRPNLDNATIDAEISSLILSTPRPEVDTYPSHELRVANEFIKHHPEYEQSRTEVYVSFVRVLAQLEKDGKSPPKEAAPVTPPPAPAPNAPKTSPAPKSVAGTTKPSAKAPSPKPAPATQPVAPKTTQGSEQTSLQGEQYRATLKKFEVLSSERVERILSGKILKMARQKILKQQVGPDGKPLSKPDPKPSPPQPNPPPTPRPAPPPAPAPKNPSGK